MSASRSRSSSSAFFFGAGAGRGGALSSVGASSGTPIVSATVALTSLVPRFVWKYQGWLNGFNGGPLRQPQQRINDAQMKQLRAAAVKAGLPVTDDPDELFFVGRNPA